MVVVSMVTTVRTNQDRFGPGSCDNGTMSPTTGRLLAVLSALQARPAWTGPQLAVHLDVTVRTVRRDIDRLRQLGYPIDSDTGVTGGYRLGVGGTAVPPLMLDTDEAFALAVWVRAGTDTRSDRENADDESGAGIGEAARRAIGKLEHMLPARLRQQVELSSTLIRVQPPIDDVDSSALQVISAACRAHDELAVTYHDRNGRVTERRLHPLRVVSMGRRWYLVARDARLPEWRTWRIDRISDVALSGHRFELTDPPDAVEVVQRAISTSPYRHQARVELHAPAALIARLVPPSVGVIEAIDDETTLLTTGGDDLSLLALHIGLLGVGFRVVEPDDLRVRILEIADRLRAGAAESRSQCEGASTTPAAAGRTTQRRAPVDRARSAGRR
jgi:predicted DNA-binding transcriptional regulator YafY